MYSNVCSNWCDSVVFNYISKNDRLYTLISASTTTSAST